MGVSKVVFSGRVIIDLTGDTVTADKLYEGVTAHGADGETITGTMAGKSDNGIAKLVDANAESVVVSADDFPAGITSIRDYAFYGSPCPSVEIPSTVTHIGREAFGHTGLSDITIPDTVESMDDGTFYQSGKLTTCKLSSGLTKIPGWCFQGCTALASCAIPSNVGTIGDGAFYGSGLVSMAVPDTVASIGHSAFAVCASLTSLSIGSGVTEIPDSMCNSDVSLASVTLPGTITAIGSGAFQSCAKLTAITLPLGLKTIDSFAFNDSGLTSLDVPASVESIGQRAIEGGIPVTVRATTPPSITSGAFVGTFVGTPSHIYVPASAVDTYKAADGWSTYSSVIEAITE